MGYTHQTRQNEWVKLARYEKNGLHSSSMGTEWVKLARHDGKNGLNLLDVMKRMG